MKLRFATQEDPVIDAKPRESDALSPSEKVALWDTEIAEFADFPKDEIVEEKELDDLLSSFSSHQNFLRQSQEYQWLLGKIRANVMLLQKDRDVMSAISNEINAAFDRLKNKGSQSPAPVYTVSFDIKIGIGPFLDRYYANDSYRDVGSVITLTGSAVNAQAVTCRQYLQQTWPISGIKTLDALERSRTSQSSRPYRCTSFLIAEGCIVLTTYRSTNRWQSIRVHNWRHRYPHLCNRYSTLSG